ncbi:phosphoglycerate mutase-like protein [Thelephora ganbajun]|uniref:Phosphoglycerate mutase-like protein n=1 Tax=Thelephora ganbajun TaxID=370292 RepID=A0ACB6Z9W5_THEGA|nr:phosphoglycerate mutase-like protein [Thelephora ganbajun]
MTLNSTYAYVPGFFAQDDPKADPNVIGALPDRFGLLDSSPGHWQTFQLKIEALCLEGGPEDSIKVFFLGRHGQGFHNVAEAKYGTQAWDDYWSKLNGDGIIVWGPDALLTSIGVQQAEAAHNKWLDEMSSGIPAPTVFYSSPLTRATRTLEITWTDITLPNKSHDDLLHPSHRVVVAENCRETYGVHTCDKRHSESWIAENFPLYTFNKGFTEEDELWTPDNRETGAHTEVRALSVLENIWYEYPTETYVSITAHGGFISALLRVVGRGTYGLPTGGVIPVVIRRTES